MKENEATTTTKVRVVFLPEKLCFLFGFNHLLAVI